MKDFFINVSRYFSYFISITLGIFFSAFAWIKPLMSRPITAIALVGLLVATLVFVAFTLRAMLGLSPV